ncbi:unnamed protein product [Protopolystoma xenopodis]|uniref:Uncharacterized protein n=1 Tax=Protopolystoma xenopodis TaxID=117903 RepID=A0A448XC12_9PLAT|nr:unnamed protein product [Protopolystoma xenopodis]
MSASELTLAFFVPSQVNTGHLLTLGRWHALAIVFRYTKRFLISRSTVSVFVDGQRTSQMDLRFPTMPEVGCRNRPFLDCPADFILSFEHTI